MKRFLKRSLSIILAFTIIFGSAYVGLSEVGFGGLFAVEAKAATVTGTQIKQYVESFVGGSWAAGGCLNFVATMFQNLGGTRSSACCAIKYAQSHRVSTSQDNIPIGADVYFNNTTDYTCSCGSRCGHIGIYVGDGYMVHASGGKVRKDKISYVSNYYGWGYHGGISIENYTEPPAAPTVYLNKTILKTNEIATLYWDSCDKAEYYWISCWSETEQCISEKSYDLSKEISFSNPGEYSITVVSVNNKGETIGNWINIEVYDPVPPIAPTVTIDKNILKINEITTLWWGSCDDADYYWISCWSETEQCISEKSYELKKEISFSEPGKYSITVVSGNDKGETIGNWINIEVYDSNGYSTIAYDPNGGTGVMLSHNVYYDSIFSLEKSTFTKNGYKQIGWNAYRYSDDKWFVSGIGWETEDNITKNGWEKSVYANPIENCQFDFSWYNGGILNDTIMFYAVWDKVVNETGNTLIDYDNGVIYTDVQYCSDVTELLSVSDTADITVTASRNFDIYGTGTVINVYEDDTQVGIFNLVVNGDTNGDSICDVFDCFDVERASSGNDELSGVYAQAGDINGDGIIDITDYQAVVNKAVA